MNENVTEFIKYYTSTEDKLDYAIFLEGEWGCGKTYYLKKTIKGLNLSERELYLSLYGINKMEEVNMKIKENLLLEMTPFMPPLDSENKVANFFISATRVANAVLQSKTGASLESIPDLLINKKEVAKKIIIVDDIERCTKNVEFQEILGYFSNYIIEYGARIIFIGNKLKINEMEEHKEKLIGYTFKVYGDINESIEEELNNAQLRDENKKIIEGAIKKVLDIVKTNNIRIVKRGIQSFMHLYEIIKEEIGNNKGYFSNLCETYFLLYIQYQLGDITDKDNLKEALLAYNRANLSLSDYNKEKEKLDEKYRFRFTDVIPLEKILDKVILEFNMNSSLLKEEVKKDLEEFSPKKENTLFYLNKNWRDIEKTEFKKCYITLKKELIKGEYIGNFQLLTAYKLFDFLNSRQLIKENADYILKIAEKHKLKITPYLKDSGQDTLTELQFSLGGHSDKFIEFRNQLIEYSHENYIRESKKELELLLNGLETNFDEFIKSIVHVNGNMKYYHLAIFKLINVEAFFKKMLKLNYDYHYRFILALEERYGMKYSNGKLDVFYYDDKDGVIKLRDLYDKKSKGKKLYNSKLDQYKDIKEKLDKILEYIEKNISKQD